MLTVSHEFHGYSDYWSGNGRRWDDNAGCLFAFYGPDTTLKDCVDQWVGDFNMGGDCDSLPEDITGDDIREAILTSLLNSRGRADYESGALCEFAEEYRDANGLSDYYSDDGPNDYDTVRDRMEDDGLSEDEIDERLGSDCMESPIWVILVEYEAPDDCDDTAIYAGDAV